MVVARDDVTCRRCRGSCAPSQIVCIVIFPPSLAHLTVPLVVLRAVIPWRSRAGYFFCDLVVTSSRISNGIFFLRSTSSILRNNAFRGNNHPGVCSITDASDSWINLRMIRAIQSIQRDIRESDFAKQTRARFRWRPGGVIHLFANFVCHFCHSEFEAVDF